MYTWRNMHVVSNIYGNLRFCVLLSIIYAFTLYIQPIYNIKHEFLLFSTEVITLQTSVL